MKLDKYDYYNLCQIFVTVAAFIFGDTFEIRFLKGISAGSFLGMAVIYFWWGWTKK